MKGKKNALVVLSTIIAMSTIVSACSSSSGDKGKAASPSPSAAPSAAASPSSGNKYEKTINLKWFGSNAQGILPTNTTILQKKMESMFNVKIDNVIIDSLNSDQVNVYLASGDSADFMFMLGDAAKIINSGAVRPISIDMLQKYAPVILKGLDDVAGREVWTRHLTVDGKLYGIANASKTYLTPNTLALRKDWMDAVGATKLPSTLKELEELLLKFRNDDPDKNGKKDTYALSKWAASASQHTNIMPYIFGAYGIAQDMWMEKDGKLVYSPVMPEYKEVLKTFQDWYKKEIFDPEVLLDDRPKIISKLEAGRIAGYIDIDSWLDSTVPSTPAGKLKQSKNVDLVYVPPVKGSTGLVGTQNQLTVSKGVNLFFGKKTTDEQVIRILQMQNEIFSDPKLYATFLFGNEGESWKVDEKGTYTTITTTNAQEIGGGRFLIGNLVTDTVYPVRVGASRRAIFDQIKGFPIVKYSNFQPDQPADKAAAMFKVETEFFWKAFAGQVDIDKEWDKYVQSYMDAGGKIAAEEANKQFQALKK